MSDHQQEHQLHNEKFQRERIALFSDAVFAIAITLLIIEIKVPEPKNHIINDKSLLHELLAILPKLIGFLISFFVIGLYWMAHHRLFRYVTHSNAKLLSNNLLFLLPIVIMPFSTAFLSEYYNPGLRLPVLVYTINICLAGLCSYRLWKIVAAPKYNISQGISKPMLRYNITRALTVPTVFLVLLLLSFINPWITIVMLPFVFFVTTGIKHYFRKKHSADASFLQHM